jgi:FkbH-like protein
MNDKDLKSLLLAGDSALWDHLLIATREATGFEELFALSTLRKKAHARKVARPGVVNEKLRVALVGGYSLYPLHDLLEHICEMEGYPCEIWQGAFDNYISEIMDESSGLYAFAPQVVLLMPSEHRCKYPGKLTDSRDLQQAEAGRVVESLIGLVRTLNERTGAEIICTNFMLPARYDLGTYRARTLGSDWSFRKWVNLELGLNAPPYLHICDLEFLAHRQGGLRSYDARGWFETKQPASPPLLADLAREVAHLIGGFKRAPKKVLVLDLDNTLWGGVIADDGMDGIEVGDTSPRGEAFKAFQRYIASLKGRGTLLAVCSKNDHAKAEEPFLKHPEMVLRMDDFVSFKANWEPKSENIRAMASELNLGLDSFAFVDDNPAEIEIVRQFAPEVTTILLGPDPSEYVAQLADCRLFEPRNITSEDVERTAAYQSEAKRQALFATVTDMTAYLQSLEMGATITEFVSMDVQRLSQLINKSNQFNLTTRRRTEADIVALMKDPAYIGFSVRLKDRFGDHGLISIVIAKTEGNVMDIDTWLMSCRVLKRQVEDEVRNELVRLAKLRGCTKINGTYLRTKKNEMVRDFYGNMGFTLTAEDEDSRHYELALENIEPLPSQIKIIRRAYESN